MKHSLIEILFKKTAKYICGIFKSQNVKSLKGLVRKYGGPHADHWLESCIPRIVLGIGQRRFAISRVETRGYTLV